MRKALFGTAILAIPAVMLTAALPVKAQDGQGGAICLDPYFLENTHATDARTLLFRMKNGEVWRNDLARPCPELLSHPGGFTQVVRTNRICANSQEFTVNATGMVCRLGEFTRVSGPRRGY